MNSDIPDIENISALTDWVELNMLRGSGTLSFARLRALLAETEHEPETIEVAINFLSDEVKRRKRASGPNYPFELTEFGIKLGEGSSVEIYKFLLLLSVCNADLTPTFLSGGTKALDELMTLALKEYFGGRTEVLNFGWPPVADRPAKFTEALNWLAANVHLARGVAVDSEHLKDGGVDLVVWKPFPDDRETFLFALVQCTIQKDWLPKSKDIIVEVWSRRIDSGRTAMNVLAIPHAVPPDFERWDEVRGIINILFERFRILACLAEVPAALIESVTNWNQVQIAAMR
jgi:hypothetical protein